MKIVLDTNVLVAAIRSSPGASFQLVSRIGISPEFQICLSVPLVLEYEDVLKRKAHDIGLSDQDIDDVIDYLCSAAELTRVFFLWRPALADPSDDFVLELAIAAGCDSIVTRNIRDFQGAERHGVRVMTPRELLQELEAKS